MENGGCSHGTHGLTDLSRHGKALWISDRGELLVPQPLDGVLVVAEIQLGAHQNDGRVGTVVPHLGIPLSHRGQHIHKAHPKEKNKNRRERKKAAVSEMLRQNRAGRFIFQTLQKKGMLEPMRDLVEERLAALLIKPLVSDPPPSAES